MTHASHWRQGRYSHCTRIVDEPACLESHVSGEHVSIAVAVLCADPVIAAGLCSVLGADPGFRLIPTQITDVSQDGFPTADVILADYDTALQLAKRAPRWMPRLVVFSNCDSEARVCLALEIGVRGYLLHGSSVTELIDAIRSVPGGGMALSPAVAARIAGRVAAQTLTPRENAVLEQLMRGLSNKGIASRLRVSVGTVKTHVKSILEKLNAHSRTAAVITAQRRGLLT